MRVNNKSLANLRPAQISALAEMGKLLEAAFKKEVFAVHINPTTQDLGDIYGVSFSFKMNGGKIDE